MHFTCFVGLLVLKVIAFAMLSHCIQRAYASSSGEADEIVATLLPWKE
jgi:hypothetical protein